MNNEKDKTNLIDSIKIHNGIIYIFNNPNGKMFHITFKQIFNDNTFRIKKISLNEYEKNILRELLFECDKLCLKIENNK